ncbi:MAG: segregation/condensation protein A [Candidatus Aenigmatarchaeota archaeon]
MKEKEILELAKREPDWEQILNWIIAEEGLDPWDVDLVELASAFSGFVQEWTKFNFSLPARVVIVMAILLRIKVELLMWEDQGKSEKNIEIEELDIDVSDIPMLDAPKKRRPTRKVTAEELVTAFKKAFETKERRKQRKQRARRRVEEAMPIEEEENIEERIDNLYKNISNILEEMKEGRTTFSSLLPTWNREEIVKSFFPLLRLNHEGRIRAGQEEYFDEIWIEMGEMNE